MSHRFLAHRSISRAGIALLIGACTSVAVAWACARFQGCSWSWPQPGSTREALLNPRDSTVCTLEVASPSFGVQIGRGFALDRRHTAIAPGQKTVVFPPMNCPGTDGFTLTLADHSPIPQCALDAMQQPRDDLICYASGWPCLSLHSFQVNNFHQQTSRKSASGELHFRGRNYPCLPIWPGFAINSLAAAAAVWTASMIPAIVRHRRRSANTCERCGYDLAGLPCGRACPECGTSQAIA